MEAYKHGSVGHLRGKNINGIYPWKRPDGRCTRQRLENNCFKDAQRTNGECGKHQEISIKRYKNLGQFLDMYWNWPLMEVRAERLEKGWQLQNVKKRVY